MKSIIIIFCSVITLGSIESIPISQNNSQFNSNLIQEDSLENSLQKGNLEHDENTIDSGYPFHSQEVVYEDNMDPSSKEETRDYSDIEVDHHTPEEQPENTCPYEPSYINVQPPIVLPILPHPPKVSYRINPHLKLAKYTSNVPYYFGLPRLSPLKTLPPVHSTYIHGLSPLDEANYDENEIYSENSRLMPNNVRIQRTLQAKHRDEYHEMLAQLEHDAIMPNILPMMAVRHSVDRNQYRPHAVANGDVVAVFPHQVSASAIPILISCAPQVDSGILANEVESEEKGPSQGYRNQEDMEATE